MAPVVAHIVGIGELADTAIDQRGEPDVLRGGEIAIWPVRIGYAVASITGLELPEMAVLPVHCRLDYIVQRPEAAGDRHLDDAPDLRFGIVEADAQAGDRVGHAAMLTGVGLAVQFQVLSSSQREAGQSAAMRAMTSAM